MTGAKAAIIVVIVLFTLLLTGIVVYTSQTRTPTTTPLPSTFQESPHPTSSPTPSEHTIEGEVLTVATSPIGFKNSYVVTVEQTDGTSTLIYITDDTVIQNSQGTEVTRSSLRTGTQILAVAAPAEGGYEAIQIQIVPSTGTTPTGIPTQTAPTEPTTN